MRMLAVELRRAFARRLVRMLAIAAVALVVVIAVGVFATHDERAPAARTVTQATVVTPTGNVVVETGTAGGEDHRFHYTDVRRERDQGVLVATSWVLFAVAVVAGASLVGAEYRFGTTTALLTWEPRRVRVVVSKLAAAGIVAAALFVLLQGLLALALVPVAATRGTFAGADRSFAGGVALMIVRGAVLAGGLAALGACIATLGRNTSAALGVLFVYLVGVDGILGGLFPRWRPWLVVENVAAFLDAHGTVVSRVDRPLAATALLLVGYLAVAVVAATAVFARRDVT